MRHAADHGCAPALQREVLPGGDPFRPVRHRGGLPLPWAAYYGEEALRAFLFIEMLIFIGILFIGWWYVIRKGAVNWAHE